MTDTEFGMYSFWRQWFAQPDEVKLKSLRVPGGKGGFYPRGSESPGYTGKPDPKEYFHFRTHHAEMSPATAEVFEGCYRKAQVWLAERGLGHLAFPRELCVLRILHYFPTLDGCAGEAHRDFDLLTVSVNGTVPGLEVQTGCPDPDCSCPCSKCGAEYGGAHDVPDCNGEAPCNWKVEEEGIQVGEMLEIYTRPLPGCWTNPEAVKRYQRATTHRVRTPPNTERFKAVFFYLPPNEFELQPGFTAGDYLKDALTRAGTINAGAK